VHFRAAGNSQSGQITIQPTEEFFFYVPEKQASEK